MVLAWQSRSLLSLPLLDRADSRNRGTEYYGGTRMDSDGFGNEPKCAWQRWLTVNVRQGYDIEEIGAPGRWWTPRRW